MTIGGIITAIVIGAVIGALARLVLPGKQNISILLTIVVGIVAALVGTAIAKAVGVSDTPGVDWIELILQVAVAAVGVTIVGAVTGRRAR
ncbi:GlsB/YeaQ/YmgE family stress response membrane protein [Kineococcus sp. GCM10028916]|uniref:GlsB/YeaQ/YmgE family stress response membrane protein n=1 Tax=Kineococcus sp. GCM10028916 TaxID=3273394 RepID=UPI003638E051